MPSTARPLGWGLGTRQPRASIPVLPLTWRCSPLRSPDRPLLLPWRKSVCRNTRESIPGLAEKPGQRGSSVVSASEAEDFLFYFPKQGQPLMALS